MLACNIIRSRSEYGSSSRRPRPPVATIANPLVSVIPISVALLVSQNSCSSRIASRTAAGSRGEDPPASSCSAAATKSFAGRGDPAAEADAPAASAAGSGVCCVIHSQRVGAPLPCAHPHDGFDGADPHLPVTDLAGACGLDDDVHHLVDRGVINEDLDPHLRHEVDGILGAAVDLGVALLPAVALHLADRHAEDPRLFQAGLDVFEGERLDDRGDQLHSHASLPAPALLSAEPDPTLAKS